MPQVLITGANRGIGQALAQHYRQAGWQVIATARRPTGEQVALDVTDAASLAALAARIAPPLDLLICNAGVLLDGGQTLQRGYDAGLWAASFAVNVTGAFHTVQALLPQLRAAGGAKIGLISSTMGSSARAPGGHYMYRASKAALVNLGRNLAADLASDGIAVGIYHPGWVQTDMGGRGAEITPAQSAAGLQARLAQLSLQSSGCFESYDGSPLPY
jgi:NAD(P)-dependent dehydrogenase (short-subunit alcohol dehydrogenase family)